MPVAADCPCGAVHSCNTCCWRSAYAEEIEGEGADDDDDATDIQLALRSGSASGVLDALEAFDEDGGADDDEDVEDEYGILRKLQELHEDLNPESDEVMFGYFSTELDDVDHLNEYQIFLDTLDFLAQHDPNVHTQLMAVLQGSQKAVELMELIQNQAAARQEAFLSQATRETGFQFESKPLPSTGFTFTS
eukprot:m.195592 g.195592  ORF g.195592 m.195592 type:complete len:191 (-) comp17004_c0_seq14:1072-1644(-)